MFSLSKLTKYSFLWNNQYFEQQIKDCEIACLLGNQNDWKFLHTFRWHHTQSVYYLKGPTQCSVSP